MNEPTYDEQVRILVALLSMNIEQDEKARLIKAFIRKTCDDNQYSTIYGYDRDNLAKFAMVCRRAGIEEEDLLDFTNNVSKIYELIQREIEKIWDDALKKIYQEKM